LGVGRRALLSLTLDRALSTFLHMQTVSFSEARENLNKVMDKAAADRAPILITRQRGENVVMISAEEWAGMQETLHLMSSPANAKRLMEGIARLDAGKGEEHELIRP
jgi:antitoxin YefM